MKAEKQKVIKIPLKSHPVIESLTTKALIKSALDTPPEGGFRTSEMRNRIKILDKVEALNPETTVLELTEEESKILQTAVKVVKWAILDKFILDFEDSLN